MVTVRVIGATGYGGIGIIELLVRHPEVELVSVCAREGVGERLSERYPHLTGHCDLSISAVEDEIDKPVDLTFCATPDRVGMSLAPAILKSGSRMIDYSGDFRFDDVALYREYATRIGLDPEHLCAELLAQSCYGVTELYRDRIRDAAIVGNPGCLAIGCILGLYPLLQTELVERTKVICDCKTGVSGAGKQPRPQFHYPNRYENMNAYRLTGHQHVMEIEATLTRASGVAGKVLLTPQVMPICRGIMSTLYVSATAAVATADLQKVYAEFYRSSPFVRIAEGFVPDNNLVRHTNLCYILPMVDERTGIVTVIVHIDNLMKGQSGSALQNMNVMFGFDETVGLEMPAQIP